MKQLIRPSLRTYFGAPIVLGFLLSLLASCAQMQEVSTEIGSAVSSTFTVSGFPESNPADSCNARVQALRSDFEYFNQPLASKGAISVLSEGVGALFSGGSVQTAMSNAMQRFGQDLVNASLSRATQGYLGAVGEQNNGDYHAIFQQVSLDAGNDSSRLANVRTKVVRLESCRREQIGTVSRNYERQRISAAQARQEARQVQNWTRRDNQVIEKIVGESGERVDVYVEADQYVAQKRSVAKKRSPARKKKARKPSNNVAKAQKNHKKAKKEQKRVAQLDQTIEQKIATFS